VDRINFSMSRKEIIEDEMWKCPECNFKNSVSFRSWQFYKLPNILLIHLKRFRNSWQHTTIDNSIVEYERYMTLNNSKNNEINYELIGIVVFGGCSINAGHYIAHVLHFSNKWYLMGRPQNQFSRQQCRIIFLFD